MVFFFLVPSIPSVLGNFLVPMMIGARDLAFPKLNLLSWYVYMVGAIFTVEPGVYLPDRGFGVRIEDEVLVTDAGYRLLTSRIPRKLEDVEAWVASARR